MSQLSTQDENIVIAAEGLIQVSPPKEVATLLQHFSAGTLIETKRALCGIKEQQMEMRKQQEQEDVAAGRAAASRAGKRKMGEAEVNPLAEVGKVLCCRVLFSSKAVAVHQTACRGCLITWSLVFLHMR